LQIQIKEFTGPLDLLLKLIRREEMDILDIDIYKITEQYMAFIEKHSIKNLDSAGDFIRMAALLIYIKSKSLFPSESQNDPELENEEDLQEELVQKLLKMKVVQSLCEKLNRRSLLNRDVWSSGGEYGRDLLFFFPELQIVDIKQQPILKLMKAYRKVFQTSSQAAVPPDDPLPFLSDCIRAIHNRLVVGAVLKMSSFIKKEDESSLSHTLVTFLALLELSRLGIVSLEQERDFSDIGVFVKKQFNEGDFQFIQGMEGSGP